ncbi:unnamed protein product [Malus baccata var. baccata]
MKAQKPIIPILVVIFLLAVIQICSCRPITTTTQASNGDTEQKSIYSKYFPMFLKSMESMMKNKINPIHAVSHRLVPGGPNPLHN